MEVFLFRGDDMRIDIHDLSLDEILHYAGISKENIDDVMLKDIMEMKDLVLSISEPRIIYQVFSLENGQLKNCTLQLVGNDIQHLLKESYACIIFAATLGSKVDRKMKQLQLQDMTKALFFDCCANAAIEAVCDTFQESLTKSYPYLTDRYSCGYGDMPITLQKDFIDVLDASKKIGLFVNENSVLLPLKSVTAIIGIARKTQPAMLRGCDVCQMKETCELRKRGNFCGK